MFAEEELRLKRLRIASESQQLALEVAQMQTEMPGSNPMIEGKDASETGSSAPLGGSISAVGKGLKSVGGSAKNVVTAPAKLASRALGGGKPSRTDNAALPSYGEVVTANQIVPTFGGGNGCDACPQKTDPHPLCTPLMICVGDCLDTLVRVSHCAGGRTWRLPRSLPPPSPPHPVSPSFLASSSSPSFPPRLFPPGASLPPLFAHLPPPPIHLPPAS